MRNGLQNEFKDELNLCQLTLLSLPCLCLEPGIALREL